MQKTIAIAAAAAVAALLGGSYAFSVMKPSSDDVFAQCRATTVGGADIGGPFELVDETGRTVTDADIVTGPTLFYFGYTFCPDICPTDNARNADAVYILDDRGIEVTPVFVSIDPERDTPERVAEFTDIFHPRMIGLTGSPEQVHAASQAFKTYYQREDTEDEYYLIDHTTGAYFVLPEHGFVEYFSRDVTPEQMADRLQCFIEAADAG